MKVHKNIIKGVVIGILLFIIDIFYPVNNIDEIYNKGIQSSESVYKDQKKTDINSFKRKKFFNSTIKFLIISSLFTLFFFLSDIKSYLGFSSPEEPKYNLIPDF